MSCRRCTECRNMINFDLKCKMFKMFYITTSNLYMVSNNIWYHVNMFQEIFFVCAWCIMYTVNLLISPNIIIFSYNIQNSQIHHICRCDPIFFLHHKSVKSDALNRNIKLFTILLLMSELLI